MVRITFQRIPIGSSRYRLLRDVRRFQSYWGKFISLVTPAPGLELGSSRFLATHLFARPLRRLKSFKSDDFGNSQLLAISAFGKFLLNTFLTRCFFWIRRFSDFSFFLVIPKSGGRNRSPKGVVCCAKKRRCAQNTWHVKPVFHF